MQVGSAHIRRLAFVIGLLTADVLPLAAQNSPVDMLPLYGRLIAASRFGQYLREAYSGNLSWSQTSGDSHYSANATLRDGKLFCQVSARSSEGTFSTTGSGLIEIELGLDPDEENPPAKAGGKMYVIRAACPHPRSSTPKEASWSQEYSTNLQQSGEFDATVSGGGIVVQKLPQTLKGQWQTTDPEESRTMSWSLCLAGQLCK